MNVFKNKQYLVHLGAFVFILVYALLWTSSSKDRNELKVDLFSWLLAQAICIPLQIKSWTFSNYQDLWKPLYT